MPPQRSTKRLNRRGLVWRYCQPDKTVTPVRGPDSPHSRSIEWFFVGMTVAHCLCVSFDIFEGTWIMKTLVSLLVGGVLLFSAATFGTQAAAAQDRDRN